MPINYCSYAPFLNVLDMPNYIFPRALLMLKTTSSLSYFLVVFILLTLRRQVFARFHVLYLYINFITWHAAMPPVDGIFVIFCIVRLDKEHFSAHTIKNWRRYSSFFLHSNCTANEKR